MCLFSQVRIEGLGLAITYFQTNFGGFGDLGRHDTQGMKAIFDGGEFNVPFLFVHLHLLDHFAAAPGGAGPRAEAGDEVEFLGGVGGVFVFDRDEGALWLLDEEALLASVLCGVGVRLDG